MAQQPTEALNRRLESASIVVRGHVESIEPVPAVAGKPIRLHEPTWFVATIRVDEALKGRPGPAVVAEFARSSLPQWDTSPRIELGQSGIWVLQPGRSPGSLLMDHPLDYQPGHRLDMVQQLVTRQHSRAR